MTTMENNLPEVQCRSNQVNQLVSLLGLPFDYVPQSIFVLGHKSSGKSFTLMKVLEHMKIHHAVVSCVEGYTSHLLFDSILNQLIGTDCQGEEEHLIQPKCEDMMDFINQVNRKAAEDSVFQKVKHVIVLEEAEYLRDMAPNLLPAFLKLRQLTQLKRLCVILVTNVIWDKFCPSGGISVPIQIYFPQYTQSELLKILYLDRPPDYPEDFYLNYLNLFMSMFWRACRDVRELRYKAAVNFTKYCEPIESGKVDQSDAQKLWQLIRPHFKASLEVIYMRTEMKEAQSEANQRQDSTEHKQPLSSSAKFALSFELPFYSKYLLIAAYLASYNSPKEDKKLYVKLSGRKKKQMPKHTKNSLPKLSSQVQGPRAFEMVRLIAIFYAIMEVKPLAINFLSQLSTLVELQLLQRIGEDALESPKFKCAVGLDFVIIIGKTLNFSVTKYLVDYK